MTSEAFIPTSRFDPSLHHHRHHHRHHHHHKLFLASVPPFFVSLVDEMMASGQLSAAQRRRGRRLRAMLRHMALAAALHHSTGLWEKEVELQQNAAPRVQNTGARARKGEVNETHEAPRRQTTPHLGERPSLLLVPGPQRSDRTVRRFSGEAPSLLRRWLMRRPTQWTTLRGPFSSRSRSS